MQLTYKMLWFAATLLVAAGVSLFAGPLAATGAVAHQPAALRVVIKPLTPFVMPSGAAYEGFSIDLWQEIAARLGRDYEYIYVDTIAEQLATVAAGDADIAITGISITKAREEIVDFSLPYYRAGLQMLTRAGDGSHWSAPLAMLQTMVLSPEFTSIIGGLALVIILVGHLFWLIERWRNPDFPRSYLPGVWEGVWYTIVTLVTVGYGDRTAKSVPGRLLAILWMFISLFLVANLTANITSQLTLSQFYGSIRSEADLPGKRIATVANSTAAQYLADRRIAFANVEAIEGAYDLLERNVVDVVVYDAPVLLYYAHGDGLGRVQVTGDLFELQQYGIAFPAHSTNREPVNRALLEIIEDGTYDRIYGRWFDAAQE